VHRLEPHDELPENGRFVLVMRAVALAEERALSFVYAVDRTGGPREAEVLSHGGDRTVGMEKLDDAAEGERGTNMQDRPPNAGYNLTPHR
jgi:hypothetical protein